jgi:hypothetical protein
MISDRNEATHTQRVSHETDGLRLTGVWNSFDDIPPSSLCENSRRALDAVEGVSRRIDDLANKLGCLGHFDQSEGPRAA